MIKFVAFSFFLLFLTLFAGDKPLNGIVIKDLPLAGKTEHPHPAKKLKYELTNEKASGEQSLHSKIGADRAEKTAAKRAQKNFTEQKNLLKKIAHKNEK